MALKSAQETSSWRIWGRKTLFQLRCNISNTSDSVSWAIQTPRISTHRSLGTKLLGLLSQPCFFMCFFQRVLAYLLWLRFIAVFNEEVHKIGSYTLRSTHTMQGWWWVPIFFWVFKRYKSFDQIMQENQEVNECQWPRSILVFLNCHRFAFSFSKLNKSVN